MDFGDGYTRNGLEAFSADAALQCMPLDVSPLVVYYNPRLIELDQIAEPGRNPVAQENDGWSLEEFGAAAQQPRRPGVRGLYVAPDLEQVAPFIWSEGGEVVDDPDEPTTLTLSEGRRRRRMEQLLELVRDPALTFSQRALRRRSALERFKAGKLGMILGYRDLTPELRAEQDLTFDVMPLPRLSSGATIARCPACASPRRRSTPTRRPTSWPPWSPTRVRSAGRDRLRDAGQPRRPQQRGLPPDRPAAAALRACSCGGARCRAAADHAAGRRSNGDRSGADDLFYQPVILPLNERLEAIDEASVPIFDPRRPARRRARRPAPPPSSSATP